MASPHHNIKSDEEQPHNGHGHNSSYSSPRKGEFVSLLHSNRRGEIICLSNYRLIHLLRIRCNRFSRRLPRYALYPLIFMIVAAAILLFGTLYSRLTSNDPCKILESTVNKKRSSLLSTTTSSLSSMPRLFHYQSKTPALSEETQSWRNLLHMKETNSQVYPNILTLDDGGWSSVYWSDESCMALVREHFPSFLSTYENFAHTIQRVDSCRYLILYKYGGVYADTDISFHSNATIFEQLLPNGVGLVESPFRYNERWQNSLMSATIVHHPFWNTVMDIMMERGGSDAVLTSTGPSMIGDAVDRWEEQQQTLQHLRNGNSNTLDNTNTNNDDGGGVHTLPCELFQRLPTGDWDTTLLNILGREVLARAIPMRGCGVYANGKCEITRHRGRASWANVGGTLV